MFEVPDGFVDGVQFAVVWRPFLLALAELLGKESQGLPTLGSALFDDGADRDVGSICGQS